MYKKEKPTSTDLISVQLNHHNISSITIYNALLLQIYFLYFSPNKNILFILTYAYVSSSKASFYFIQKYVK